MSGRSESVKYKVKKQLNKQHANNTDYVKTSFGNT